jgi:hypothetical protein
MYPANLLAPLVADSYHIGQVCGICALEWVNKFHGIKRGRFTGQVCGICDKVAEKMRQDAIRYNAQREKENTVDHD